MNSLHPLTWTFVFPAVIVLPLLVALALAVGNERKSRWLLTLAPWTAMPALFLVLFGGDTPDVHLPFILLGTTLGLDAFSRVFLLFTSLLWWMAGLHALGYIPSNRQREFFGFFLAAMAGNLGLLIARDIGSFYALYALMSFASYGLVVHLRNDPARYAGNVYLVLVVLGEMLLFPALAAGYAASEQLLIADWAAALAENPNGPMLTILLLLGFGIKAGVLPLHIWLPLAHPAAPTPASAVLSGAMIKAGLFGMTVFLPLGALQSAPIGATVMVLSLAAAVFGAGAAITQTHPKALLAYSSISKMGPMTFAVGAALYEPTLWPVAATGILIFAMYHALTKGALFLSVGAAAAFPTAKPVRTLLVLTGFLPLLVFAGFPATGGAIAKLPFKELKAALPAPWAAWLNAVLLLVAFATVVLLFRFELLLIRDAKAATPHPSQRIWIPWLGVVLMSAMIHIAYFGLGWEGYVDAALSPGAWGAVLPPLLIGLFFSLAVWRWGRRTIPTLPPGDILHLFRPLSRFLTRLTPPFPVRLISRPTSSALPVVAGTIRIMQKWLPVKPFLEGSGQIEKWLMEGPLAGTLVLILFLSMILALAL
ncbi:MAG: complex I subunit 5 family protein [Thermodesulfobacteriota bacterium]